MNRINSVIFFFSFLLFSCHNNNEAVATAKRTEQQSKIRELETTLHASSSLNAETGKTAVREYLRYATLYPDDSLAADYLFKGGEIATALKDYSTALHCYQLITQHHASFAFARESFYLQGYLLDNFLNDDAKAKIIYEQFLVTYPTGNYSNDAKAAIVNLGKTDEELIKEFEAKNKGK